MLIAWPPEQHDDRAWGELTLSRESGAVRGAGVLALMADGSIALVGNDLSARDHIRSASLEGLALALVIVTALALAAGVALNRRARVRVAAISRTAEDVMAGRLHARVPVEEEHDVVDHLAVVVNQMLDRLEILFAAMRAVTDSLAHDLRTPLNRLQGALERASSAAQGHPVLSEIERAQGEAGRLSSTFAALIDIARAESGLSEEAMEMVDLKSMVEGLADLFGPSAEDRGLSIQVVAPELSLRAHRPLLAQALGNLIDNAIKFAPPGGVITIDLIADADGAEIVVTDSGPGMAADRRARAGERFAFAEQADHGRPAGTGLGLSIVAATARLHKGALMLEDNHPGLRARLSLRGG
jgi:signal transduction histidine kinase